MFTAALFTLAKIWKQTKHPSTDECMLSASVMSDSLQHYGR